MRTGLCALLLIFGLPSQDDSELYGQLSKIADHACDLDPAIRAEAVKEATKIYAEQPTGIDALASAGRAPAKIVHLLATKKDAADLFKRSDKPSRQVACDLMDVIPEHLSELLKLTDEKDLGLRLAACRALGRLNDPAARQQAMKALTQKFQKRGVAEILFYYVYSFWYPGYVGVTSFLNDADPDRATAAVAALCNLPKFSLPDSFSETAAQILENDKIDAAVRSLLIRTLSRRSAGALLPLLTVRDPKIRSQVVEALDQGTLDPAFITALYEWTRKNAVKDNELLRCIERWLKRATGEKVTLEGFEEWYRKNYKPLIDRQVDAAITLGCEGLRRLADKDGTWHYLSGGYSVGVTALAVYALLKCDVPPDDRAVARGLEVILSKEPEGTYSASLMAMALATAVEKSRAKKETTEKNSKWLNKLQHLADVLVASQTKPGGWTYQVNLKTGTSDQAWMNGAYDLSNAQFGVLGLRACANGGATVPAKTWERALALYEQCQGKDGGFPYTRSGGTPSMTAAGAYSWIICKISLNKSLSAEEAGKSERIRNAVKYLEKSLETQPPGPNTLYFLYSLERFCMTAKLEKVGKHDWYYENAPALVRAQGADGTWQGIYGGAVDTSFALLFLRRAFIARDVATESVERRATPEQAAAAFRNHLEALRAKKGVKDVQLDKDERTSYILLVVDSEETQKALVKELGKDLDNVPLRFLVEK